MTYREVVEPTFVPGAICGWETAAPLDCGSAAVHQYRSESFILATIVGI
jgi:hypothetical protein